MNKEEINKMSAEQNMRRFVAEYNAIDRNAEDMFPEVKVALLQDTLQKIMDKGYKFDDFRRGDLFEFDVAETATFCALSGNLDAMKMYAKLALNSRYKINEFEKEGKDFEIQEDFEKAICAYNTSMTQRLKDDESWEQEHDYEARWSHRDLDPYHNIDVTPLRKKIRYLESLL